ncbi:recombination-associated protein RdgC [Actinobacillus pleuropneumoniae]|uniref:recombination-associated protein RdgC n=1 Tax=Actinobacillus pleuropneumoniae TaxID=715 RepID=UPI000045D917|nr:recombination-associated protein RdgC [Actinobacillus pleuropneumoniae]VTR45448.1 recombination associated protein [Actinobacillus pleuropneumoniae]
MFWFKNLMTYRLTQAVDFSNLEEQLKQTAFTPCGKSDMSKFGWSAPLSASDSLCFRQGSNTLIVSHKLFVKSYEFPEGELKIVLTTEDDKELTFKVQVKNKEEENATAD